MATTATFGARALRLMLLLCAMVGASLALASAAQADTVRPVTFTPANPTVNEQVTFTFDTDVCTYDYTFTVDGVARPPSRSKTLTTSFATAGDHTVSVASQDGDCGIVRGSATVAVRPALVGTITATPAQPTTGQSVNLAATQTGGVTGYTYSGWTADAGAQITGPVDDSRQTTAVFFTTGPHVVKVTITDAVGHQTTTSKTISVVGPTLPVPTTSTPTTPVPTTTTPVPTTTTPGATTPRPTTSTPAPTTSTPASPAQAPAITPATPAAAIPACPRRLTFELTEVTTTGCFTRVAGSTPARWTTTDPVKVNGILFRDFGQTFTVTFPGAGALGGRFSAPGSSIQFGSFTAFSGDVDWTLPVRPTTGTERSGVVRTFPVLLGTKLFGLNVRGTIGLRIGILADGSHYASFPLTIELPVAFNVGPDPSVGRATGAASLRVDDAGVHYDGLKLEAEDVWVGKVKVAKACFSFIPAGGESFAPCPVPVNASQTQLGCATDVTTDRWDGSATVVLGGGDGSERKLSAFGGLAGGDVSKLGGSVSGLGRLVPLAPNVYLDGIGFGLCLRPPPLKLAGNVSLGIFPLGSAGSVATVEGSFLYTDAVSYVQPWSIQIGGKIAVRGTEIGSGSVTYRPTGSIDFGVSTAIDLAGVVSVQGEISGWVDAPTKAFTVTGTARVCLPADQSVKDPRLEQSGLCASGSATVSDTGAAGCITLEDSSTDYGTLEINLNTGEVKFRTSTFRIRAGFGYRWGGTPAVLGDSCDFTPYQSVRPGTAASLRAAGPSAAGLTQRVAAGTPAVSLRIHGSDGPPKVVLNGPGGRKITSPAGGSAQQAGSYLLAENAGDGTTNVVLVKPAAGTWTITAALGAASAPTRVDRAAWQAPPTVAARVRGTGAVRTVDVAYAVPAGATVSLTERRSGVTQTIAESVRGRRCATGPKTRPGSSQPVRCATLRFRPSRGPGGVRRLQAVVSRGGVPLRVEEVAQYRTAAQRLPARPGALRARRSGRSLVVTLPRSAGASRLTVAAALGDGRRLGFDLPTRCRTLRIGNVPNAVRATITAAGLRYDLAVGPKRTLTVKANAGIRPVRRSERRPRPSATACS